MSDNVSQLSEKKPGLVKKLVVFALLALLVAGGAAAYVFRDRLDLDSLQRYVRYLNISDDSRTGRFVYDESNSNQYAGLSDGLAVASAVGLNLYDKDGVETASIQKSLSVPTRSASSVKTGLQEFISASRMVSEPCEFFQQRIRSPSTMMLPEQ